MKHNQIKKMLLEDQGFKKEYENEFDVSFEVAKYVRQLRIKHELTQAKLAKLVKTKQTSIARIENPGSPMPSLRFLKKIAKALKTELIPPKFLELEDEIRKNESNEKIIYKLIFLGGNKEYYENNLNGVGYFSNNTTKNND